MPWAGSKELCWCDAESLEDAVEVLQRNVRPASLNVSDEGAVKVRSRSQFFL
jgi:hypothetical protein